ncbi:MAG TPA: hypothetical protein VJ859_09125 [Allosphingosinicella sp.]|nr:hypothetical protein [Allosphingosinicella sp.]
MEGFGCNLPNCPYCPRREPGEQAQDAKKTQMDEDVMARMVAVLCASILAAAAGEKDHVTVLATSDIYLDFIRPRALHVSRDGEVSFEPGASE